MARVAAVRRRRRGCRRLGLALPRARGRPRGEAGAGGRARRGRSQALAPRQGPADRSLRGALRLWRAHEPARSLGRSVALGISSDLATCTRPLVSRCASDLLALSRPLPQTNESQESSDGDERRDDDDDPYSAEEEVEEVVQPTAAAKSGFLGSLGAAALRDGFGDDRPVRLLPCIPRQASHAARATRLAGLGRLRRQLAAEPRHRLPCHASIFPPQDHRGNRCTRA